MYPETLMWSEDVEWLQKTINQQGMSNDMDAITW